MRPSTALIPLVASSLFGTWSCSKPDEPQSPSFAVATCSVAFTYIGNAELTVSPNSTNNDAGWFIRNDGSGNVTLTSQTLTKSGSVTAVRPIVWAPFPYTLAPGAQIDADMYFDVGPSGIGKVGMTVGTNCGSAKVAPPHTVSISGPPPTPLGIPFGPYGIFAGSQSTQPNIESFNLGTDDIQPQYILDRITSARAKNLKLMMQMTGGPHSAANPGNFLSVINDTLRFDMTKWTNYMNLYNTTAIKTAVNQAVADGVIIGNNVMDEPNVSGIGDGNTWGPKGTMTKARVDAMCAHVKSIFPTLPVGVAHKHDAFEPTKSYAVCDFVISQYSSQYGSVDAFKQAALDLGLRDHHAIAFSMNILNGGTQDNVGAWDCPGTGGKGTYSPNCRMTAAQVKQYGQALGVAGCAMTMWRYDQTFMSNTANKQAFADVRSLLNTKPSKPCRRT